MSSQPPPAPAPAQPPVVIPAAPQQDLTLEIHHLFVKGGDATAVVVRNTADGKIIYKVLIDAGAEGSGSSFLPTYMAKYLEGDKKFDLVIATHYHKDHIHGFAQAPVTFSSYMDNGGYMSGGKKIEPQNGTGFEDMPALFMTYTKHVRSQGATRIEVPFIAKGFSLNGAAPLKLELGKDTGVFLTCYCANGILANGTDVIKAQKAQTNRAIGPNDVSLAFVLTWEDFSYFTAGDLSGDAGLASYFNIEGELVKYLTNSQDGPLKDKPITVLKVSHHGSEHSNQVALFEKLKPKTIIVSCNQIKKVPSPEFLTRVENYLRQTNGTIVFANQLKVKKNDPRYAPLKALASYTASNNVTFIKDLQGNEILASNLHVHAIVIRRRQTGGAKPADPQGQDVQKVDKGTYDILMRVPTEGRQGGATAIGSSSYENLMVSFDKKAADETIVRTKIDEGFVIQSKAIVVWLDLDKKRDEKEGMEYLKKYYPALVGTITEHYKTKNPTDADLEAALVETMKNLFNNTFKDGEGQYVALHRPNKKQFNDLDQESQETIFNLLWNNKNQAAYNGVRGVKNTRFSWAPEHAWNHIEPSKKQKAKEMENVRPVKRMKLKHETATPSDSALPDDSVPVDTTPDGTT